MRIIRAADCRVMPWKNGGGATTQIAIHPEGASLDDFDWRISTAHVGTDGSFSLFPGIDRTLAVLTGTGIALAFGDGETMLLGPDSDPCAFAGDRPVEGRLVAGAVDDLNVMTRRGRWRHRMRRLETSGDVPRPAGILVLLAIDDGWSVEADGRNEWLGARDAVLIEGAGPDCQLRHEGAGTLYAIELWPANAVDQSDASS